MVDSAGVSSGYNADTDLIEEREAVYAREEGLSDNMHWQKRTVAVSRETTPSSKVLS